MRGQSDLVVFKGDVAPVNSLLDVLGLEGEDGWEDEGGRQGNRLVHRWQAMAL